jgi:hypothetical protein
MRQRTFSSVGFEIHGKQTRRQRFLTEMDAIVPWRKLARLIEPHYPKGHRGRPPIGIDSTKSRVRAYVEHPFRILKCVFGFRKVCYRGIAKNLNRLQVSFALVNLYMKRRTLMRCAMA